MDKIIEFLKKIFTEERLIFIAAVVALVGIIFVMNGRYNTLLKKYDNSVANNKAYRAQLDEEKGRCNVFQMTVDELRYTNDSIAQELLEQKKELKIKDKEIRELNYLATNFNSTDTLYLKDTIFKDFNFVLDTTVGDEWVSTKLHFEYPNAIEVSPSVKSEKTVLVYSKKETIDPPKKFFICRWFQKKHTVTKVVVNEKNPHMVDQQNVFYSTDK